MTFDQVRVVIQKNRKKYLDTLEALNTGLVYIFMKEKGLTMYSSPFTIYTLSIPATIIR